MTRRLSPLRRAAAALLVVSGAVSLAAAAQGALSAKSLALWETVAPETMKPEALALHVETLLAEAVDAAWLARETEAALAADPLDWSRLDALDDLAEARGLALPPELAARRAEVEALRPWAGWACLGGVVQAELPDEPTAIGCYFGTALTPVVGEAKDLGVEGAKLARGEAPDWVIVSLAGLGIGATALGPASLPARYAVATVKTARKLGVLSASLAGEIAALGRRVVRVDRAAPAAEWVDAAALRALSGPAVDIGRVALDAGPVTAARALRHVDTLDDAGRLRRLTAATGGRPGPALEALGLRRVFAPVARLARGALEVWGLAAAALAQLGLAALALGEWGLARALRPRAA